MAARPSICRSSKSFAATTRGWCGVFVASRAWFEYAQQPLPPPSPDPEKEYSFDRYKYRLPKAPAVQIFRGYPALAQEQGAEAMEQEGWFDADGWLITDWFERSGSG